jgi:hypothetical protein
MILKSDIEEDELSVVRGDEDIELIERLNEIAEKTFKRKI